MASHRAAFKAFQDMESLDFFLQRNRQKPIWDGDRLSDDYRNITRFVLRALYGRDIGCGSLNRTNIFLTDAEAKLESSPDQPRPFREQFIALIVDMLGTGNNPENSELKHFIKMAPNRKITFKKLFHHPLLQSTTERFRFPTRAILKFKYNRRENWEQEYKGFNKRVVNFDSQIQKSIYKDAFKSLLHYKQQQETAYHGNWEGRQSSYENTVAGVLRFSENAANHINRHLKNLGKNSMTEKEIENELTKMFPTRLIDLYEFLVSTDISMDFLD